MNRVLTVPFFTLWIFVLFLVCSEIVSFFLFSCHWALIIHSTFYYIFIYCVFPSWDIISVLGTITHWDSSTDPGTQCVLKKYLLHKWSVKPELLYHTPEKTCALLLELRDHHDHGPLPLLGDSISKLQLRFLERWINMRAKTINNWTDVTLKCNFKIYMYGTRLCLRFSKYFHI